MNSLLAKTRREEDIHRLEYPFLVYLGERDAVCKCGQFRGTWKEYLQHLVDMNQKVCALCHRILD